LYENMGVDGKGSEYTNTGTTARAKLKLGGKREREGRKDATEKSKAERRNSVLSDVTNGGGDRRG